MSVEAARNTKNAAGPMRKILLIDKGRSSVHNFKKTLTNKGHIIINANNLKKSLSYLESDSIDLVAVESNFSKEISSSGKFKQLTARIPKIILVNRNNFSERTLLHEDVSTVPLREPFTLKEFGFWIKKLIPETSKKKNNTELQSEITTSNKKVGLFNDITEMLNSTLTLDKSLTVIMDKLKTISDARAWSLLFNDEPLFETISLKTSKKITRFRFNKGVGITGWVIDNGLPLTVHDVSKDKRFNEKADKFINLRIKSLICVPLKIKNRVIGVLRLINKNRGERFSGDDRDMLINTGGFIAMAIEMAFLNQKIKHDDLTDLYNINYFNEVVDMEIEKALRYNLHFSVIFMDIDNFKDVNDTHGHLVGSRVLIEMAQVLQDNLRKVDIIARYGGDEFVMVLPQTSQKGCYMVAERLRIIIEKNVFLKQKGYAIKLTSSFGVASCPENAKTREQLMRNADKAMYDGKFSTKNIVFAAK